MALPLLPEEEIHPVFISFETTDDIKIRTRNLSKGFKGISSHMGQRTPISIFYEYATNKKRITNLLSQI